MKSLLKKLNIDEKFTKPSKKQKTFNNIKNNIPHKEDYNFMADLLELPKTKKDFKYLLVVVDLASDEFDIEPMTNKESQTVLNAMKTMFKRKHINKPYATIRTDGGSEFKSVFHKYLQENLKVLHKVALPNRHKQMANVESLNKQLARLFNGYMNKIEIETKKTYREWTDILKIVREELNKIRKKDVKKLPDHTSFNPTQLNKYKVGDIVHQKLDWAENALGNKQSTPFFRMGDFRFSSVPKKILQVLIMNDYPYYRYIIEGLPNVSYSENELIISVEKESKFKVKKIIGKKKIKKEIYYLVWFEKYLKRNAVWLKEKQLLEDGLKKEIDEFNSK